MIRILEGQGSEQPEEMPEGAARVERDGLAVVHEGEWIVPAPGAEAELTDVHLPDVVIEVPVEITVGVHLTEEQRDEIAERALRKLRVAIEGNLA